MATTSNSNQPVSMQMLMDCQGYLFMLIERVKEEASDVVVFNVAQVEALPAVGSGNTLRSNLE